MVPFKNSQSANGSFGPRSLADVWRDPSDIARTNTMHLTTDSDFQSEATSALASVRAAPTLPLPPAEWPSYSRRLGPSPTAAAAAPQFAATLSYVRLGQVSPLPRSRWDIYYSSSILLQFMLNPSIKTPNLAQSVPRSFLDPQPEYTRAKSTA
jgi:hypothetical protein